MVSRGKRRHPHLTETFRPGPSVSSRVERIGWWRHGADPLPRLGILVLGFLGCDVDILDRSSILFRPGIFATDVGKVRCTLSGSRAHAANSSLHQARSIWVR